MKFKYILLGALLLIVALGLAACSQAPAPVVETTPCPAAPPCPECPAPPTPPPCPEPVVKEVPFQDQWVASPHNDAEAEAFNHWNEDDPKEVPTSCATCHSTPGYQDFLGADGSPAGVVDKAAPIGTTIQCVACHNAATATLSSVTFPSGAVISGLGPEARCMVCHQGRASKVQLDEAIDKAGLKEDLDKVSADLGFINIHYFAAAASLYGGETMGGYQYEGKTYDAKFRHVEGYNTCVGCHNQHTTELKIEQCAGCHEGVASKEDLKKVRMNGSLADYDGDGNVTEGISEELDGMRALLLSAIQSYAKDVAGTAIGYNPAAYPYFFADPNGDGQISEDEAVSDNAFKAWTGRLLRASYNYQTSVKDPGSYAHGGKYMIELLYDSIEDLNSVLATPVDLSTAHREDPGHFAGDTEPFRHWDAEGEVEGACARCHSATGLPTYLKEGVNISAEISNGFMCTTCHNQAEWPARYVVNEVTFPSGAVLTFGEGKESNLCIVCHQGRSSTPTVDKALGDKPADTVDDTIRFSNIHYFAAGATVFGNEAQGAYQFKGKEYVGRHPHVAQAGLECKSCHDVHALAVKVDTCAGCHAGASDPKNPDTFRMDATDWNGNGNTTEGVKEEIATFGERLYAAIQAYAKSKGTPIVYDVHTNPYFFVDMDENGEADVDAEGAAVRYSAWTPSLLRSAYNYQYWQKDPGNFAHNAKYMLQILYDSIANLKGDVSGLTRP